jgi:hypothetical protein
VSAAPCCACHGLEPKDCPKALRTRLQESEASAAVLMEALCQAQYERDAPVLRTLLVDLLDLAKHNGARDKPTLMRWIREKIQPVLNGSGLGKGWLSPEEAEKLRAYSAALRRALEAQLETHDQGHSPCACIEARDFLASPEKEKP